MHRHAHESQESCENGEPLLSRSPQSLSQSELGSDQHANRVTTDTSERAHPSTLHLKEVTWDALNEIDFPPDEHFDIVDGLLVWVPMAHGTTMHQRVIRGLVQLINLLHVWSAISGLDVEVKSSNSKSAAAVNRRGPDVIVTRRDSPASSESPPSPSRVRKEKHVLRTKDKPPFAVLEVTSESTRDTDITIKWAQYRRTGIKFYYIIDLHVFRLSGQALVIVGSKYPFEGAFLCQHGSPGAPPSDWTPESYSGDTFYYKKVYSGDQQVDVGIFQDSPFKASQLMDPLFLKKKVDDVTLHKEDLTQQNAHLRQRNADLTQNNANLNEKVSGLTQNNANLDEKVSDLTKHNTLLIQQLNEVRSQRTSGHASSSKSRTKPKTKRQKDKPTSPSRKQSTESPPKSPTNSPKKKRPKPQ